MAHVVARSGRFHFSPSTGKKHLYLLSKFQTCIRLVLGVCRKQFAGKKFLYCGRFAYCPLSLFACPIFCMKPWLLQILPGHISVVKHYAQFCNLKRCTKLLFTLMILPTVTRWLLVLMLVCLSQADQHVATGWCEHSAEQTDTQHRSGWQRWDSLHRRCITCPPEKAARTYRTRMACLCASSLCGSVTQCAIHCAQPLDDNVSYRQWDNEQWTELCGHSAARPSQRARRAYVAGCSAGLPLLGQPGPRLP